MPLPVAAKRNTIGGAAVGAGDANGGIGGRRIFVGRRYHYSFITAGAGGVGMGGTEDGLLSAYVPGIGAVVAEMDK